jgi:hypothetical protein
MMESHIYGIEGRLHSKLSNTPLIVEPNKLGTEPIFFSVPNTDTLFVPESRSRTIEILTERNKDFNMQIFSKVTHGFAVSS